MTETKDLQESMVDIVNMKWEELEGSQEEINRFRLLLRRSVECSWGNYMEKVILNYLTQIEDAPPPIIILNRVEL